MTSQYSDFYREEAPRYDARRFQTRYGQVFRALHLAALNSFLAQLVPESRIVDIGCGTGHTSRALLHAGFRVTGVDVTVETIRQSLDVLEHPNFDFVTSDAFSMPFNDGCFDAAISTRVLHLFSPDKQRALLAEITRVVRPGGTLVVDYDNKISHVLLRPFLIPYNLIRYRRWEPDTHYNTQPDIQEMHEAQGLVSVELMGVAGYHLVLPAFASAGLAIWLGAMQGGMIGRIVGEQLMVKSRRP